MFQQLVPLPPPLKYGQVPPKDEGPIKGVGVYQAPHGVTWFSPQVGGGAYTMIHFCEVELHLHFLDMKTDPDHNPKAHFLP